MDRGERPVEAEKGAEGQTKRGWRRAYCPGGIEGSHGVILGVGSEIEAELERENLKTDCTARVKTTPTLSSENNR